MPLHLHVICKRRADGAGRENCRSVKGEPGLFRSGVWPFAQADRGKTPDYIWLHEGLTKPATLGGRVVDSPMPSCPDDLTPGNEGTDLTNRFTLVFRNEPERWAEGRISWCGGAPIFHNYAFHED